MDSDEIDNAAFVEAVNNAQDDDLSLADWERHTTSRSNGCFALAVLIVIVAALAFSLS
jgi:hypothetical protein